MPTIHQQPAGRGRDWLVCTLMAAGVAFLYPDAVRAAPAALAAPSDVPDELRVDGPLVTIVHAVGAQVYKCTADAGGTRAWVLKGPDATFKGPGGLKGRHFEGPSWESSVDHSKVAGQKIADHQSPEPSAVSWLLLKAASHDGTGLFSTVTFIQRLHTTGGKAPAAPCGPESPDLRVPYTADYVFYGTGATPHQAAH
jgi:hypothetical protein